MAIWTFFSQVVKVDLLRRRGHKWKNTKVLRPWVFPLECWVIFWGHVFGRFIQEVMIVKPTINHPAMWGWKTCHQPMLWSCADTVVPRVSNLMMKYDKSMPEESGVVSDLQLMVVLISTSYKFITHLCILFGGKENPSKALFPRIREEEEISVVLTLQTWLLLFLHVLVEVLAYFCEGGS